LATILARSPPSRGADRNVAHRRDDLEPARIALGDVVERRQRALVALDRDDAPRAQRQQRAGQPAGAGADSMMVAPSSGPRRARSVPSG
jgi:hypothetical protein